MSNNPQIKPKDIGSCQKEMSIIFADMAKIDLALREDQPNHRRIKLANEKEEKQRRYNYLKQHLKIWQEEKRQAAVAASGVEGGPSRDMLLMGKARKIIQRLHTFYDIPYAADESVLLDALQAAMSSPQSPNKPAPEQPNPEIEKLQKRLSDSQEYIKLIKAERKAERDLLEKLWAARTPASGVFARAYGIKHTIFLNSDLSAEFKQIIKADDDQAKGE